MFTLRKKRKLMLAVCLPLIMSGCQNVQASPVPPIIEDEYPLPPLNLPIEKEPPKATKPIDSEFWDVTDTDISQIDTSKKLIAFTFDDAPARTLENIVAVFASYNERNADCPATATLFCNGHLCHPTSMQTLKAAHALGFEMGNHSYSHPDLTTLDESTLKAEIQKTDVLLEEIDGKQTHLFRAPFGRINGLTCSLVQAPVLDWTIDTLDWTGASVEDIYNCVWQGRFDGAIVLMHDGYDNTVDALKKLLPDLKADGYQAVTISQMSKANACPLRKGSVYIRARKKN